MYRYAHQVVAQNTEDEAREILKVPTGITFAYDARPISVARTYVQRAEGLYTPGQASLAPGPMGLDLILAADSVFPGDPEKVSDVELWKNFQTALQHQAKAGPVRILSYGSYDGEPTVALIDARQNGHLHLDFRPLHL